MSKKIVGTPEAWEDGSLGREDEFVRVSKNVDDAALNDAAGLQPISIRLQKSLIEEGAQVGKHRKGTSKPKDHGYRKNSADGNCLTCLPFGGTKVLRHGNQQAHWHEFGGDQHGDTKGH